MGIRNKPFYFAQRPDVLAFFPFVRPSKRPNIFLLVGPILGDRIFAQTLISILLRIKGNNVLLGNKSKRKLHGFPWCPKKKAKFSIDRIHSILMGAGLRIGRRVNQLGVLINAMYIFA